MADTQSCQLNAMGKAMRSGALIRVPGSAVGRQTFLEWLDAKGAA